MAFSTMNWLCQTVDLGFHGRTAQFSLFTSLFDHYSRIGNRCVFFSCHIYQNNLAGFYKALALGILYSDPSPIPPPRSGPASCQAPCGVRLHPPRAKKSPVGPSMPPCTADHTLAEQGAALSTIGTMMRKMEPRDEQSPVSGLASSGRRDQVTMAPGFCSSYVYLWGYEYKVPVSTRHLELGKGGASFFLGPSLISVLCIL